MFATLKGQNGEKVTSLMFNHCQWHQLYEPINQKAIEKEERERKAIEMHNRIQKSIDMAETWDNTYINIRKRRYEKRKERMEKEKEYRDNVYKQLREESENALKIIREKAKEEAFYEQDCTKNFHSAFRNSEVEAERLAQLEFNDKLKKINKEIEVKYAESIISDVKKFNEEQEKELIKKLEMKKTLGIKAKEMFQKAEETKKEQKEQKKREEKEDCDILIKQLNDVIQNKKTEVLNKKKIERRNLMENRELIEKTKEIARQEEDEENQAIDIINRGKTRIAKIRREKEEKMLEEKRNRFNMMSNDIQQKNQVTLEKEEESRKNAIEWREKQETNQRQKEKEYQEMLKNERIKTHLDCIKKEEERLAKEKELLKMEVLRRFKREELNNQFTENQKEQKRNKMLENRNVYRHQIESDIDRRVREKEVDLNAAKQSQENWEMSDKQFLEYAYKVRDESKNKGRPLFPLDAAIYDFKKTNNLLRNVRNFIYDAKIKRPDGIKDTIYHSATKEKKDNSLNCKITRCLKTQEYEDCGCSKKANGL